MISPIEPNFAICNQLEEHPFPRTFNYKIHEFERFYEQSSCADKSIEDKSIEDKSNEDKSTEVESNQPKNESSYVSEAEDATGNNKSCPVYQAE